MSKLKQAGKAVLAVTMSLTMLAACSSNDTSSVQSSVSPGSTTVPSTGPKKEISVSMFDRGAVPTEEGTYENNRWTKWINEKSPVNVKWVPVTRSQAQPKLNALIASGEAPDLIWEYDRNYISQLANQGVIQPIGDYINKYSTTYKAYLEKHPELKPYLNVNGQTYAVSFARDTVANHGMWIRQDWLDKLGLKTPTTAEEFLDVARKFRDGDPDGNGKADTVPISLSNSGIGILRALFFTQENQWYVEGGKLEYGRLLDRYADSLAFQKQLFDEGLIDKEYITDTNFQRSSQLLTTGKAGIYLGQWGAGSTDNAYRDLLKNVPDAKLTPLESVSTKYGKDGLYQEAPPSVFTVFNSKMKEDQIKSAIQFIDWMLKDGWVPLKYGEENVHYKTVDGARQTINQDKFIKEVSYAGEYALMIDSMMTPKLIIDMAAKDEISQNYAKLKAKSLELTMKNTYRRDIPYSPDIPELTQLIATFSPIAVQIETKVVTGGKSITAQDGLNDLRKEWKRLGGDNVDKQVQDWYQKNKNNFK
ncbi:extracellular solute-binding protein [Paenibacillus sp. HWE-109]|uniref:extracellular solute-binding protein n=1 Tax=Paenibacillus sp. HWE-109 TaxID=1306526 RepID=UPI001EDFDDAB|nr:extracellular solute-binding protein [Paenibacillus sp. HWE-109]UKS27917.1 extracellular solute-binding protein [Paenibacillus sp. HWE-109]